jgi:hypothetical protein
MQPLLFRDDRFGIAILSMDLDDGPVSARLRGDQFFAYLLILFSSHRLSQEERRFSMGVPILFFEAKNTKKPKIDNRI